MTKLINNFFLLFFVVSCSSIPKIEQVEKPHLNLSPPYSLDLYDIQFKVIRVDETPYFALTEEYYKNLSLNIRMVINYMKEQKEIIEIYQDYYEGNSKDNDVGK